ncbi:MAG: acyl-CoA dehydrogenase family protein [Alphaproteobacteria bacterium]|nr:acyl-CoA dehydrogenase family protein [Alphaproteobacteria bacterium]MCB9929216.1 acyl-CoA dehydrogenase family protein [Alphaproteobacteria bacterium]
MTATRNVHRNIPDSRGVNVYASDPAFADLLDVYLAPAIRKAVEPHFQRMGGLAGDHLERLALDADKNPPVLHIRARNGADDERIEKHPAYVALEDVAFGRFGLAAMSHRAGVLGADAPLPPLVKYGLTYLFVQAEFGLCCPLSMTDSLTRTLRKFGDDDLIARYIDGLTTQDMEALTQGAMFMTEQVAGSDVGAIETVARFEGGDWKLYGDKWFCSNPDAGLAMVLARPEGGEGGTKGLSLFLLPRHLPDGSKNAWRILRLKDKLGTRSMASGEVVLEGAVAYLVGEAGNGFKQMTDMINMSRLSNGVRAAGLMRRSVNEALFIARNRTAFGQRLIDLPLMRRQIAKMLVTAEQGRAMVFHTARVLERADAGDAAAQKALRILTPLIKFRTCRDARKVAGDAMEVRGGCGYIEEWSDARVLRDAHLGSIWEGTSNIVALDVTRATRRAGALDALEAYVGDLLSEIDDRAGLGPAFARAAGLTRAVASDRAAESEVRRAASGLYNAVSAVFLAWEADRIGARTGDFSRRELARMVVEHKLTPRDPLAPAAEDGPVLDSLFGREEVAAAA